MPRPRFLLPTIVVSVLWGSSLWFAVNAVLDDLGIEWNLPADALSTITSVVQLGFIAGTLVFAFTSIPDRFSPRKVFLVSSIAAALANVALTVVPQSFTTLLILRFITGFFLAGIYPVGMKITAGWYSEGLGRAIGYLVGALVLGTAIPHLITSIGGGGSWTVVIYSVSVLAVLGGIGMFLFVPDGPYIKTGAPFNPRALVRGWCLTLKAPSVC